jgi:hypothetical protein
MAPRKNGTPKHQNEPEPEPTSPRTWAKNATHRPGADTEKVLQIQRDPEVIEKEREERKRRKEEKEQEHKEEEARKDSTTAFIKEYRAQQAEKVAREETSIPRRRSQGMVCFLFKPLLVLITF